MNLDYTLHTRFTAGSNLKWYFFRLNAIAPGLINLDVHKKLIQPEVWPSTQVTTRHHIPSLRPAPTKRTWQQGQPRRGAPRPPPQPPGEHIAPLYFLLVLGKTGPRAAGGQARPPHPVPLSIPCVAMWRPRVSRDLCSDTDQIRSGCVRPAQRASEPQEGRQEGRKAGRQEGRKMIRTVFAAALLIAGASAQEDENCLSDSQAGALLRESADLNEYMRGNFACEPGWGGDGCLDDTLPPTVQCETQVVELVGADLPHDFAIAASDLPLPVVSDGGPGELGAVTVVLSFVGERVLDSLSDPMHGWISTAPFDGGFEFAEASDYLVGGHPLHEVSVNTTARFRYEATDSNGNSDSCDVEVSVL
eukprot:SAG22_NODE_958_length_6301_cov_4.995324_13_plen_361_part_00